MNEEITRKLVEDVGYIRGTLDSTLPGIKDLLEKHDKRIAVIEVNQAKMKTKVGVYGSIAGVASTGLFTIIFEVIKHYLNNPK